MSKPIPIEAQARVKAYTHNDMVRAFVRGSRFWQYKTTDFTMFSSERDECEAAAIEWLSNGGEQRDKAGLPP